MNTLDRLLVTLAAACLAQSAPGVAAVRDVINLGATPSDSTDDAPAIQKAIDAAAEGDTVSLPRGAFLVNRTLRAKSGVRIQGAASDLTILKFHGVTQADFFANNTVVGNGTNNELTSRGFANRKPVADFTCTTNVVVGQIAVFTNTSSDADGRIGHVLWDFGEGVPSTQFNDTHVYGQPGIFRVTLVVWDDQGRGAIRERSVTVKRAPQ